MYEQLFNKQKKKLVDHLKGSTNLENNVLESLVDKWFIEGLCKWTAVALVFSYSRLEIDQHIVYELKNVASNNLLTAHDCLSSFLDSKEIFFGSKSYHFTHVIQKETLANIYLRNCIDNELKYIAAFATPFVVIGILDSSNDFDCFLNMITYIYKYHDQFISCYRLLSIEREKFYILKSIVAKYDKKLNIYSISNSQELKHVIELFLPETTQLNCRLDMSKATFDHWKDVVNEYKDKIHFTLDYDYVVRSNDDIIEMAKEISEPFSDSRNQPKCFRAKLDIQVDGGDPTFLIKVLTNIVEKFYTLIIKLDFNDYKRPHMILNSNVLSQFASKVTFDIVKFSNCFTDLLFKLLNAIKVNALWLDARFIDKKQFSKFFKQIQWKTQTYLIEVNVEIKASQLKYVYKNIPQEIASKTCIICYSPIVPDGIPRSEGKTLRTVIIKTVIDDKIYKTLKKIANTVLCLNDEFKVRTTSSLLKEDPSFLNYKTE